MVYLGPDGRPSLPRGRLTPLPRRRGSPPRSPVHQSRSGRGSGIGPRPPSHRRPGDGPSRPYLGASSAPLSSDSGGVGRAVPRREGPVSWGPVTVRPLVGVLTRRSLRVCLSHRTSTSTGRLEGTDFKDPRTYQQGRDRPGGTSSTGTPTRPTGQRVRTENPRSLHEGPSRGWVCGRLGPSRVPTGTLDPAGFGGVVPGLSASSVPGLVTL